MVIDSNDVWLLLEAEEAGLGAFADGLICEGRRLADALGGELAAVLLGPDTAKLEEALAKCGADRLYCGRDAGLADYHPEIYASLLSELVREHRPRLFLTLDSARGADLMPRLAATIGAPLVMNCTNIEAGEEIEFTRPVQSGRLHAVMTAPAGGTSLATLNVEYLPELKAPPPSKSAEVCDIKLDAAGIATRLHVTDYLKADPKTVDIREAEIVVAVGNGIGERENFAAFEQFAELIGAALGGSRPVIDSGILPHERQIGQTGRAISARLAILCGISGSEYFTKGIERAGTKVAINSDREAPIFKDIDLGIVADINALIPKFTAHIKGGTGGGGS
ncbi:MAG: electron transfer flavoprotein subunit alpha/FixB family protein [Alphaproteobacteria bacterium]|nr:electron transfer flavoprotein subunit alpha/FixB family protein [Alphaproteobacteria bacterium]